MEAVDKRSLEIPLWKQILDKLGIYAVVIALLPFVLLWDPSFLGIHNLGSMFIGMQHLLIVVLGASFITYSGKMADLSIPSTMAAAGFVTVSCLPFGFPIAIAAGLLIGVLIGGINGAVIGYLNLNPIIWTLAMNFILRGVFQWAFAGTQVYPPENESGELFLAIASERVMGFIPVPILIAVVIAFVFHYVMKHSRFGQSVQMTGASERVAEASGIKVAGLITTVFVLSSVCTALGGITLSSSGQTATFDTGLGYDFNAVTVIVLGGISLKGGKGFLSGALGGLILMIMLENVFSSIQGVNIYWQEMLKAVIFISVVGINTYMAKKAGRG